MLKGDFKTMMKKFFFLIVAVFLHFICTEAFALQLIGVPEGVWVRSYISWDDEQVIGGLVNLVKIASQPTRGRFDLLFSRDELCEESSYITSKTYQLKRENLQDLSHLCHKEDGKSLKFLFISDSQMHEDAHKNTAQFIKQLHQNDLEIRFLLHAGDISQKGDSKHYEAYDKISTSIHSKTIPIVPVIGNHEYYKDGQLDRRNWFWATDSTSKGFYVIDYGHVALIVLNSNIAQLSKEERREQTSWLRKILQKLKGQKTIIAAFHHPIFTSGYGSILMPVSPIYINYEWQPLFEEAGVKLVLNGHVHIYERLLVNGVRYITAGPAGGSLYPTKPVESRYSEKLVPKTRTVTKVEVMTNGDIVIKAYDAMSGNLIDDFAF